jgi:hypothetical protein
MAQPDFNALRDSMTNTAEGFRNAAAEMDNTATEMDKIQPMAAANIVRQLTQIQAQINRMEQNILRQLSRSYVFVISSKRVELSTDMQIVRTIISPVSSTQGLQTKRTN